MDRPAASPLTNEHVQETLIAEALASANVGFLVWDDDRRYLAANACACKLLGATLDQLVGSVVGERTVDGAAAVEAVVRGDASQGQVVAERFDGSGPVKLEYVSFTTKSAGLPYMASLIWPAD